MKKIFFLASMLAMVSSAFSEEYISVDPLTIPQGRTAEMLVNFNFNEDHEYVSYQFTVELPTGLSLIADEYGKASYTLASNQPTALFNVDFLASNGIVKVWSSPSTKIDGASGLLISIPIKADESLAVGTELSGKLKDVEFTKNTGAVRTPFADADITFTIGDSRLVFDETATVAPAAATGVNVKVMRTINAGEWSTICLPFAMDATQVTTAFGDDVQLGDFDGIESTTDAENNVTAINVKFNSATAIEANHPYIIKVTSSITEFTADAVDVDPQDASVDKDETKVKMGGKWYYFYNSFIGTYVAETPVPDNNLFLSGNKFWYSKGLTKIKAFRAYFDFQDILSGVDNSSAPVFISFGSETTGIENIQLTVGDDRYYNLNGQHVENLKKGQIYIKNNKKVVVK